MPEAELRQWAQRVQSGAVQLADGSVLEIDMWRPPGCILGTRSDRLDSSLWNPKPPSKPFLSFVSSIQRLRRFLVWHGDVHVESQMNAFWRMAQGRRPGDAALYPETSTDTHAKKRHAYVAGLLEALAPVAGTLEELSIRIQTADASERRRLPQGEEREAIVAGLRRLTALRSLDLADSIGASGELLLAVGSGLGGLRSLRIAHHEMEYVDSNAYSSSARSLAAAIELLCPLLEELRVTSRSRTGPLEAASLAPLFRMPLLRAFGLDAALSALPKFASSQLETLELASTEFLHNVAQIDSLRTLTLLGSSYDWPSLASVGKLHSLSIGPRRDIPNLVFIPPPGCLTLIPRLTSLERLSIQFSGSVPAHLAPALAALAEALPSAPSLRALSLTISKPVPHAVICRDPALSAAAAALVRAAKESLEEYIRDQLYPTREETAALAACMRLRRASLILAETAETVAAEGLAALEPLATMAARPAPAPGDLVLVRCVGDLSEWGSVRPLLASRWRLEYGMT
eukprot:tig00000849_g4757.t1